MEIEKERIKFEELDLTKNIKRALADIGYVETTEIQEKTIPEIINGRDIIGQSQTGTGKTASYSLPIIQKINKEEKKVQAIILCPTRELAIQVTGEIRKFTKYEENIKCLAIYGGDPIEKQIKDLKKGVKIVIGTPGRVMDHMRRKTLKLDKVNTVVLDEADEMLNMGFEEDIRTILSEVPNERQTVLFSATMNERILEIAKKYLKKPIHVKIKTKELTCEKIEQISLTIKGGMKDELVMRLIEVNNPKKTVVFCNTKRKVDQLIEVLRASGYKAEGLHGDIKQSQRQRVMNRLKKGEFDILVATDVVARGIDVDELELVINYDIPQEEEYYVHRIGRTGRNGNTGKAYTFVVGKEKSKMYSIQKYANTKILEGKIPTESEINKIKTKRKIEKIQNLIDEGNYENKINNQILEELLKQNDIETIAKALLKIVNTTTIKKQKINKIENIELPEGKMIKLFINVGNKDKIKAKDIVGSISANTGIKSDEMGKIKVLDKFSFIEMPRDLVEEILISMNGKQIKGRDCSFEIANS